MNIISPFTNVRLTYARAWSLIEGTFFILARTRDVAFGCGTVIGVITFMAVVAICRRRCRDDDIDDNVIIVGLGDNAF